MYESDWARHVGILKVPEHWSQRPVCQRVERIRACQSHRAANVTTVRSYSVQVAAVQSEQCGDVSSGGMTEQVDARRIAPVLPNVCPYPMECRSGVLHEVGETSLRISPVIGYDDHKTPTRKCLANEPIMSALPALPATAVKEKHYRPVDRRVFWNIDVKPLTGMHPIGVIRCYFVPVVGYRGIKQDKRRACGAKYRKQRESNRPR